MASEPEPEPATAAETLRGHRIERLIAARDNVFEAARNASRNAAAAVQASIDESPVPSRAVQGLSIWGTEFSVESIVLDDGFVECAVPALVGVPLMAKPLPGTERACNLKLIDRAMVDATTRLPPPGPAGAAPRVLFARADGVPFSINAWSSLDDYICTWRDIEDAVYSRSRLKPDQFGDWLQHYHLGVDPSYLNLAFPVGLTCEIRRVQTRPDLNGQVGAVVGYKVAKGRVKLKIADGSREEVLALKPQNLKPLSSIGTANTERLALRPFQRLLLAGLFHQSDASHLSSDLLIGISECLADSGTSPFSHAGAEVLPSHREEFRWHAAQDARLYRPGTVVVIHGLVSAAHHNGKRGTVQKFNTKKGRYDVETEEGCTVATKPSNIRRAQV